jgi:hypothetical protein
MDVGPKIAVLAEEDVEEDPDRWCSYTECGQELWALGHIKYACLLSLSATMW